MSRISSLNRVCIALLLSSRMVERGTDWHSNKWVQQCIIKLTMFKTFITMNRILPLVNQLSHLNDWIAFIEHSYWIFCNSNCHCYPSGSLMAHFKQNAEVRAAVWKFPSINHRNENNPQQASLTDFAGGNQGWWVNSHHWAFHTVGAFTSKMKCSQHMCRCHWGEEKRQGRASLILYTCNHRG